MSRKTNPHLFYVAGEAPGAPGLKGSRCTGCARVSLQSVPICPYCFSRRIEPVCIGTRAELVGFSLVHHAADGFDAPYVIGEVKTDEGPTTFAPILAPDFAQLTTGMRMQFALVPRPVGDVVGFAYVPEPGTDR